MSLRCYKWNNAQYPTRLIQPKVSTVSNRQLTLTISEKLTFNDISSPSLMLRPHRHKKACLIFHSGVNLPQLWGIFFFFFLLSFFYLQSHQVIELIRTNQAYAYYEISGEEPFSSTSITGFPLDVDCFSLQVSDRNFCSPALSVRHSRIFLKVVRIINF